jgi:hypothetical protein
LRAAGLEFGRQVYQRAAYSWEVHQIETLLSGLERALLKRRHRDGWKKETKMKVWQVVSLVVLGISLGVAGSRFLAVAPVQAHGQFAETELCATSVPKSWGEFRGASEYGIAFEDQNGTIRFLRSPSCVNGLSSTGSPLPPVDLKLERK